MPTIARRKDLGIAKAGSCEIDVACPQAAPWTNEVRSVARIQIAGTNLCSGTLIMDASRDFRAFFLTETGQPIAWIRLKNPHFPTKIQPFLPE